MLVLRGVGIDIVDLDRIREQIKKGDLFAKSCLLYTSDAADDAPRV